MKLDYLIQSHKHKLPRFKRLGGIGCSSISLYILKRSFQHFISNGTDTLNFLEFY